MCTSVKQKAAPIVAPSIGASEVTVGARRTEQELKKKRSGMGIAASIFTGDRGVTSSAELFSQKLLGVGA
jgi:hypothetical protein